MVSDNSKADRLFLVGMILSMLCWGFSWASGKAIASYGSTFTISFYRFVVTFISLLLILVVAKQKLTIQKKGIKDLVIASILIAVYFYFFFKGLALGRAGAGGVLVTVLNPIVSYLLVLTIAKRLPTRNEALGLLVGLIAGVILLKLWSDWDKLTSAGTIYFLLASFTWAILSVFTSRSGRYGLPATFSLWMYGICSLLMFFITDHKEVFSLIKEGDFVFWANLFFSATITTALATTFYFIATSKLGAGKASSFIFLVPFSAALGAWMFLDEVPQIHTVVGGAVGIVAVFILNKK